MEERELILRAGKGETDAFSVLVDRYCEAVFRRLQSEPETAGARTVETFLKAWRNVGLFQFDMSFLDWLLFLSEDVRAPREAGDPSRSREELCREIMASIRLEKRRNSPLWIIRRLRFTLIALVIAALLLLFARMGSGQRRTGTSGSAPGPSTPQVSAAFGAAPEAGD